MLDSRIKPYPEGKERSAIVKAFDHFFETIRDYNILEPESIPIDLQSENTSSNSGVNYNQFELEL